MRTRQLNAIKKLEDEGYTVKVVDQNFSEEFIVYAHSGGECAFREYIVSSAGKLIHVTDYRFSPQLLDFFENVEPLAEGRRRRVSTATAAVSLAQ